MTDGLLTEAEVEAIIAESKRMTADVVLDPEVLARYAARCRACGAALTDAQTVRRRYCDGTCRKRAWRRRGTAS